MSLIRRVGKASLYRDNEKFVIVVSSVVVAETYSVIAADIAFRDVL